MVFVLGKSKKPLMPCSHKRARLMLQRGRARANEGALQTIAFKVDPGSKKTGIALVRQTKTEAHVLTLIEIEHRGKSISENLKARSSRRRRRRSANLRYRAPRFNNRTKPKGWLAPSLQHRVESARSWFNRLSDLAPIGEVVQELVRFDMQKMENAEISGVEYQFGTLLGYEVREYVFEKIGRELDRVSNLVPACIPCNEKKSSQSIQEFMANDKPRAERILKQAKAPLKDAAAVNATRWALFHSLSETGVPVSVATGGRTKYNRSRYGIPKTHALDAVCAGVMDDILALSGTEKPTLAIKCMGRGAYQRTRVDAFGFPRGFLMRTKSVKGFATGDVVRATVPKGKKVGSHLGRVAVRKTGSFNIQTLQGAVQGISWRNCRLIQRNDGNRYSTEPHLLPALNGGVSGARKF